MKKKTLVMSLEFSVEVDQDVDGENTFVELNNNAIEVLDMNSKKVVGSTEFFESVFHCDEEI